MQPNTDTSEKAKILIVDDDLDCCQMLTWMFNIRGYLPIVASSGGDALKQLSSNPPDVIVLDIMMPDMDGWETYRRVRRLSNVPVLFLTALASGACAARALTLGVNDYIRKPFHAEELVARTEALLRTPRSNLSYLVDGKKCRANHRRPTVSVIVPTLNEAENLPYVLPLLPVDLIDEVILIDGRSTDDTIAVARELMPCIKIVMERKPGKGAALRSGFAAATGDLVITLDADGSTDPREIPAFIGALRSGADFVKGSRFVQGAGTLDMPFYRRVGNGLLVLAANLLFQAHYTDITYGYNATWRCYAQALALDIDGWACEIISNIRAICNGLRVVEVASMEHERICGEAKLRAFSAGWTILRAMILERFKRHDKSIAQRISSINGLKRVVM